MLRRPGTGRRWSREARDHVTTTVLEAANKVKDARTLLEGGRQEAGRRVATTEAAVADAEAHAAAAKGRVAQLEAAAQESSRADPSADLPRALASFTSLPMECTS